MNDITAPKLPFSFYHSLPKVELHRHLEGSLRLSTLLEVGRAHGLSLPETGKLRELVQVGDEEDFTFENFLSKFQTLRRFFLSKEVIERITHESIADAAMDNVRYLELRFTPVALGRAEGFELGEVMDWVIESAAQASREYGIKTRLITSVNRHEPLELAEQVVKLSAERLDKGILGIDMAGNEADFSGMAFLSIFKQAKDAGLSITIHAGEWGGPENVRDAILYLNADRIGHGVRILEDPQVTRLARDRGIPFEVCVTSNYQSGVTSSLTVHPLPRMLSLGLNASINTDDPSISQITLSNEYRQFCEDLNMPLSALRQRVLASAQAAFLPPQEKAELIELIEMEFPETAE